MTAAACRRAATGLRGLRSAAGRRCNLKHAVEGGRTEGETSCDLRVLEFFVGSCSAWGQDRPCVPRELSQVAQLIAGSSLGNGKGSLVGSVFLSAPFLFPEPLAAPSFRPAPLVQCAEPALRTRQGDP